MISQNEVSVLETPKSKKLLDEAVTEDNTPVSVEPEESNFSNAPFEAFEKQPCDWNISLKGDGIEAMNRHTGKIFEGSMADFNAAFKQ